MTSIMQAAHEMQLSIPARRLLSDRDAPRDAVRQLLEAGHDADALGLLARLLPRRYAVAWACQNAREHMLARHDQEGLALAEQWVREPAEPARRTALTFARIDRCRTLGGWMAAAAAWSGGDIGPASSDKPIPAAESMTACAVNAVMTRLAAVDSAGFVASRRRYVVQALGLLAETAAPKESMA